MVLGKKYLLLMILLTALFANTARAVDKTLQMLLDEALANNPDIQAAQSRAEAARERIPQAKALDDPQIGVMFDDVPIDTGNVKQAEEIDYRIEQKIPFPGKRLTRKKVARWEAEAVAHEAASIIQDVLLEIKKTYYELFRIERVLALNRENQALLQTLVASAQTTYAAGQTSAVPVLKAHVDDSLLKGEELRLQQERITHQAHLKALLGRDDHADLILPPSISIPSTTPAAAALIAQAHERRPELGILARRLESSRSQVTAAKQSLLPDLALSFQYGQRPGGRQDTWTGAAMINLPVFFWGKNRHAIQEAKASLRAAEAMVQSMQLHTEHDVAEAVANIEMNMKLAHLYEREILPSAKAAFESARVLYATGKGDAVLLIEAAKAHRELSIQHYEALAAWGKALASLERIVGGTLQEQGEKP